MADRKDENADFEQLDPLGDGLDGDLGRDLGRDLGGDLGRDLDGGLDEADLFPQPGALEGEENVAAVDQSEQFEPLAGEEEAASHEDKTEEDDTEEDTEEKGGLLRALSNANPYTVMLGVALAAILTACTCLLLEWSTYNFDKDASEYIQRAE